jgi:hypothetical protein
MRAQRDAGQARGTYWRLSQRSPGQLVSGSRKSQVSSPRFGSRDANAHHLGRTFDAVRGRGRKCLLGQGPVGKSCMQLAAVVCPDSSLGKLRGGPCVEDSWRVISPMRPINPGTNRISTTTTMMNQRTQRGAPPDTCLDHELVKLDHRAVPAAGRPSPPLRDSSSWWNHRPRLRSK